MCILVLFIGMVGLCNISVGDYVKEGQDLINIEDIVMLCVDFCLLESYFGCLKLGQMVEVMSDVLFGEWFKVVFDVVDLLVDQGGRVIFVWVCFDNVVGQLCFGLFVCVCLFFGEC